MIAVREPQQTEISSHLLVFIPCRQAARRKPVPVSELGWLSKPGRRQTGNAGAAQYPFPIHHSLARLF